MPDGGSAVSEALLPTEEGLSPSTPMPCTSEGTRSSARLLSSAQNAVLPEVSNGEASSPVTEFAPSVSSSV